MRCVCILDSQPERGGGGEGDVRPGQELVALGYKVNQLEYFGVEEHQNLWEIPLNYVP